MSTVVFGVDVGGSHVKAAPVDVSDGELVDDRERVATPSPGTPDQVMAALDELAGRCCWSGPVGVAFPGVIDHGVVRTAAHLDPSWLGVDLPHLLRCSFGDSVSVINDADAAGLAEVRFGAGFGHRGVVVMVTLGTGIGTGVFSDGHLVPNTELGHLPLHGDEAERLVSARAKDDADESWADWAVDLDHYLRLLERVLWPSLIIIGGGISKKFDHFGHRLTTRTPVVAARHGNDAGIIGAALAVVRDRELAAH